MKGRYSVLAGLVISGLLSFNAQAADGESILKAKCAACHQEGDSFSRIDEARKTPEGWLSTVARMENSGRVRLSDEERSSLVKHLADTRGLAPEESTAKRFSIERHVNTIEQHDIQLLGDNCSRCHSTAYHTLQRRTQDDWNKLVNFHLVQYPSMEFHSGSRDRDFRHIALEQVVPSLGEHFPLDSDEWKAWQAADKPGYQGDWVISGHLAGQGAYSGRMTASAKGNDHYDLVLTGHYADGRPLQGKGEAIIYNGFEWRANLTIDGVELRQVLMGSDASTALKGRQFQAEQHGLGGEFQAVRSDKASRVIAAIPGHIRAGETRQITLVGTQLDKNIELGDGLKVKRVISASADRLVLEVSADAKAERGQREHGLVVYQQVDGLEITPNYALARVGNGGGKIPNVKAGYRAFGIDAGQDGKLGTKDDLRIGELAANWKVKNFDALAEHDKDANFAGKMDAKTGIFSPNVAGLNPDRKYQTNNAGNLTVVAEVVDGERTVTGESRLVVSLQRFRDMPLL